MLGLKGIYALVACAIYSILIGLFIKFTADILDEKCTISHPCVRFCSEDKNLSDSVLKDKFKKLDKNIENNFTVLRGEPKCRDEMIVKEPSDAGYDFTPWGSVYHEKMYKVDRYCIFEEKNVWKMKVCELDLILHDGFHIFSIIVSVSIITFTIGVYAYYTELRDTHGKCLMSLLSSLLLIYIFLPTTRFHKYLIGSDNVTIAMTMFMLTGFLMTFFWLTTISFHVYWRLNNFKKNIEDKDKFKTYLIFTFVMTAISVSILICDIYSYKLPKGVHTQIVMIIFFLAIAFIVLYDILLILVACCLLIKRSRSLESDEEFEKFKFEKKWFWMHAANLILLIITFPFEVFSWQEKIYLSQNTSVIVDCIKMYTAINLCIVFVLRSSVQVKIVRDYKQLKESLSVSISTLNLNLRSNSRANDLDTEGVNEEN